ncbi:MAG TPA: TadE/TadG family type IV pilus assembly protein [Allosphingosinicella sp.]|nr:TadE/TadG family type IV pilus assembly protein [Allosphingosinicella sp.]
MAATARRTGGFLGRLFGDRRGNTLAIVGAAMVPLAAMIGSGVDMSRAYMAKTRLQNACDSAALAARRVLENDTMTNAVRDEGRRFFNFNFKQGQYGTAAFTPTVERTGPGTVQVTASTTIPTTVMKMFGFTTLPLSVTCDASLNFVNTDVMLVLDTTGSMNRDINDNNTNDDSARKITALRAAVMALYTELRPTQTQLEANGLRLRYGIVPYSSTVNVGPLISAVDANYIRGSTPYQTRELRYNTAVYVPTDTPITVTEVGLLINPGVQRFRAGSPAVDRLISNTNCGNFGNNVAFSQSGTSPTGGTFTSTGVSNDADIYDPDGAAGPQANAPAAPTGYVRYQFSRNTPAWTGGAANRVCDRNVVVTRRSYTTRYRYTSYRWGQSTFDTSELRGGSTTIATNTNGTVATAGYYNDRALATAASTTPTVHSGGTIPGISTTSTAWNGCIEERDTDSAINTSTDLTIPTGAKDLNINLIPTDDGSRWRPHWPQVLWSRDTSSATTTTSGDADYMGDDTSDSVACPTQARRLQAWTEADLQTYVNGLAPRGYTYHDIGMIWGARLLSNAGAFAADNPDTFNAMPVTRHIIFMTDGVLMPQCSAYSAWGIEKNDRRVTNSYSCTDQYNRHMQRFQMVCNAARGMGFSVWVIAFGTTLTPEMTACASNPNQASVATSSAALIARFRQIGANIGALRLTQ